MKATSLISRGELKNILYATDFSLHSNAALPYALSLARKYSSSVLAVHVISLSPFSNSTPTLAWQSVVAQAVNEAQEGMAKLEEKLKSVQHESVIRKGEFWKELTAIIAEKKADLIVVGTHGRTGMSKVLMGSVAERIFRQAPCPVLTVGPNVVGEPESVADAHTILYATDFSPESLAALPYAISPALDDHARLYLLHVADRPVDRATEDALKSRLLGLVPSDAELRCQPRAYVVSGAAPKKILELAEELGVDLVVLGVKPTLRLSSAATHLGMATAYEVVVGALCPVLTVRRSS